MVTVNTGAETIQGRKVFKGGKYSRAETIRGNTVCLKKLEYKIFHYAALHAIQKNLFMLAKKYFSSKGLEQYYGLMVDHKHS